MKDKIQNSVQKFLAVAIIGLVSFSSAYSFSGNGKSKKAKSGKNVDIVRVADASPNYSADKTEEILMKELMKKISQDYKTTNITIAIDGFEKENLAFNKEEFIGKGEVKIGEFVWNTINFDVILDENKKPTQIKYEIKD